MNDFHTNKKSQRKIALRNSTSMLPNIERYVLRYFLYTSYLLRIESAAKFRGLSAHHISLPPSPDVTTTQNWMFLILIHIFYGFAQYRGYIKNHYCYICFKTLFKWCHIICSTLQPVFSYHIVFWSYIHFANETLIYYFSI